MLLTEAPEGGWGLWGHAHTNEELVAAARAEIAKLQRLNHREENENEHQSAFD